MESNVHPATSIIRSDRACQIDKEFCQRINPRRGRLFRDRLGGSMKRTQREQREDNARNTMVEHDLAFGLSLAWAIALLVVSRGCTELVAFLPALACVEVRVT